MKRLLFFRGVLLLVFSLFGTGCGTAMLSDEYLANKAKGQFAQMKKAEKISSNASHKAMVNRIGKRISGVAQVDLPGTEWEFVVFDKKNPNAFAMPGGKVGVHSGLIALAKGNEDEVAAVIGHVRAQPAHGIGAVLHEGDEHHEGEDDGDYRLLEHVHDVRHETVEQEIDRDECAEHSERVGGDEVVHPASRGVCRRRAEGRC